jgi:UDP-3-O-[3-hydroxymyristoyl] glucosamine N-acyltransferase
MQTRTVKQLAELVNGTLKGDPDLEITSAATLDKAKPGQITFLSNTKYEPLVKKTKAGAVITSSPLKTKAVQIITKDPYYAFMQSVVELHGHRKHKKSGISQKAVIADSANIQPDCHIHENAVIAENVKVGKGTIIYPGVFIGESTEIGSECIIYPNAAVYDNCRIGNRVIIHASSSVGQDGFGFSTHQGVHHKIPQIGGVILEDEVEIGACSAIERGTLDDTVIGQGTKVGDCVAIGHGAVIGPHCLLVPQVGIAGSAKLGHHCVIGGQAGIVGHIKIGNMVKIAAQAGVISDVADNSTILGAPAVEAGKAKRAYALIEYLPDIRKSVKKMKKRIEKLESQLQEK